MGEESCLQRVRRIEAELVRNEGLRENNDNHLKFLNAAYAANTTNNSPYTDKQSSPYLAELLKGLSYGTEKAQRLGDEIGRVKAEGDFLAKQHQEIRRNLKAARQELERLSDTEGQYQWIAPADSDMQAVARRKELLRRCAESGREIDERTKRVEFLTRVAEIVAQERGPGRYESEDVDILLWGALTTKEKVRRLQEAAAEERKQITALHSQIHDHKAKAAEILSRLQESSWNDLATKRKKLYQLLDEAEKLSLQMDWLGKEVYFRDELAGFKYFRGDYRQERYLKIAEGAEIRRAS
jgi:hypothetical protein